MDAQNSCNSAAVSKKLQKKFDLQVTMGFDLKEGRSSYFKCSVPEYTPYSSNYCAQSVEGPLYSVPLFLMLFHLF